MIKLIKIIRNQYSWKLRKLVPKLVFSREVNELKNVSNNCCNHSGICNIYLLVISVQNTALKMNELGRLVAFLLCFLYLIKHNTAGMYYSTCITCFLAFILEGIIFSLLEDARFQFLIRNKMVRIFLIPYSLCKQIS